MSLLRHDLRLSSTELTRRGPFDIAVAHFNFLNLFPLNEVQEILRQLMVYVSPGVRFVTDCAPPDLIPAAGQEHRLLSPQIAFELITEPDPHNSCVTQIYRRGAHELRERYWLHPTTELSRAAHGAGWQMEAVHGWRPDRLEQPWTVRRRTSSHRVCIFRAR